MPTISGRVVEEFTGAPVEGATVTAAGRSATTDANGNFTLNVPKGTTSISVEGRQIEPHSETLTVSGEVAPTLVVKPVAEAQE